MSTETETDQPESTTSLVAVASIDVPADFRKPTAKKVGEIATSFESEGQLQSIGVRAGAEGRLTLVFGGHRLAAAKKLEWPYIEAKLFEMSEREAEAAMHAENLWRSDLSKPEYLISLKRWSDIYKQEHPETTEGRAGREAVERNRAAAKAGEGETCAAPKEPPAAAFSEVAAATTGLAPRTVRRHQEIANKLGEDGLKALQDREVGIKEMKSLADVSDPETRRKAVALASSGMEVPAAIARASVPDSATEETVNAEGPQPKDEEDMTDEEWIEHFCGRVLARIGVKAAYTRDALLYRHINAARQKFRNVARPKLAQSKTMGLTGPYYAAISRVVNIAHPKHWLPCGHCNGSGNDANVGQCGKCRGNGYATITEATR